VLTPFAWLRGTECATTFISKKSTLRLVPLMHLMHQASKMQTRS
jgi:hypothetical protein